MNTPKIGIKTSEFWLSIIAQLVGIALMANVISPDTSEAWVEGLQLIVGGMISIFTGVSYIVSRTELKKYFEKPSTPALPVEETVNVSVK